MRVLLTGATGLLGQSVAHRLLRRGHSVAALHRRPDPPLGAVPWSGEGPMARGMAGVRGDLGQSCLGLRDTAARNLANGIDLVLHCAAVTGFAHDPETYQAVNVDGVVRILAFAETAGSQPVPFLHVSTAYVCGDRSGPIKEAELDQGQGFRNLYEASKAAGERLVLEAVRRGLRAAIARPSIIVGAWTNGAIDRFENIYTLIRLVTEGRIGTLPAQAGASLNLVPIDHVSESLIDIAENIGRAAGQVYHLVSRTPVPVTKLRSLALQYPHFRAPIFVPPEKFDLLQLSASEQSWHRRVAQLYGSYLQRAPCFEDRNLGRLSGRVCPSTDPAFLRRMIDFAMMVGFLPQERQRTSG